MRLSCSHDLKKIVKKSLQPRSFRKFSLIQEEDYLETDLNANDSLETEPGHLSGLALLQSYFPAVPEHNSSPEHIIVSQASVSSYPTKRQNNKWASGNTYAIERTAKADAVHHVPPTEGT